MKETGAGLKQPVIIGEALFDRFPDGVQVLGGAPFNVAWHLQGFGATPKLISRVGEDAAGQKVREAMVGWGMDISGLTIDPTHPTGAVDISFNDDEHRFAILSDQAYDHISREQLTAVVEDQVGLFYQGTLIARSRHLQDLLIDFLRHRRAPLFVDLNLRDPWWRTEDLPQLLRRATWLKVNEAELRVLAEQADLVGSSHEVGTRIRQIHQIELLILTLGANGAIAFPREGTPIQVTPEQLGDPVDTVGAGDAFVSVTLLGLLFAWSLEATMRRAQQFASQIVQQKGATKADRQLYRQMLRLWNLNQL